MNAKIIENIEDFPQFEAQNVFQTVEWMRLFEGEDDTKVVLFAVYETRDTRHETRDVRCAIRGVENAHLLLLQPITIQRFVKWLPWRLGAYAVAWREPWRAEGVTDDEAIEAFKLMHKEIVKYCKKRALYIEYRHFSEKNIYGLIFNSQFSTFDSQLPWYNIYRDFEVGEDVTEHMNKAKRRQLRQSFEAGVEVVLEPTKEQIVEWYGLLKRLYRRIHRPLPSVDVFLKLNELNIGRVFVVVYNDRVVSGSAILCKLGNSQLFYDWYRASVEDVIDGVYPSVVSTWQAMQLVSDMGGGSFDFMGAGPRNKEYGVRKFKLTFGGELTPEYRYRRLLI
ncbi:MAG: hypothetical protein IJY67_01245 [Paludibacteraceae bacterium]|nr:hypothetical protein [Paludibacteraceae bacterium]